MSSSAFFSDPEGDEDHDLTRKIAKFASPLSAQSLVGPPPDSPPQSGPGETTPQTGSLRYAPQQATPKSLDSAAEEAV